MFPCLYVCACLLGVFVLVVCLFFLLCLFACLFVIALF
jgi:hypothetical protein